MIYQDVFIEQSVRRKVPGITRVYAVIMYIITAFVAFNFVFVSYQIFGIPLVLMVILCYFFTQNPKLDFDYAYTNGNIEITRIKRRRKRQTLVDCEMKDVVVVARSRTEPVQPYIGRRMPTYDCLSHERDEGYYTMIVRNPDTKQETKVLFEPEKEMLEAMHRVSPDKVHL